MTSAKTIEVPEPGPLAATATVEIRGRRYTFRELDITEYDKVLKQATSEKPDEDGIMQEITDNTLLLRLLVLKSSVDPKLTAESVGAIGARMYRALGRVVNDLHFGDEPVVQIAPESTSEETPKGNE